MKIFWSGRCGIGLLLLTWGALAEAMDFFPANYLASRKQFVEQGRELKKIYPKLQQGRYRVESSVDADLTTDFIYIPGKQNAKKLIIVTTGIHGVEAYAGSALLQVFMREVLPTLKLDQSGVLLYHALNPYGFKYGRRVSEKNVDLNRNSIVREAVAAGKNTAYKDFNDFLNPRGKLSSGIFSKLNFYFNAIYFIGRYGLSSSRKAILTGQYEYPKGLYFGGQTTEDMFHLLGPSIERYSRNYSQMLFIDVHTGYGKKGHLHLLAPRNMVHVKEVYQDFVIDYDDKKDFYKSTGDLGEFVARLLPEKQVTFMVFEFGTLDNLGVLGSLDSLSRMISENQGAHWGYETQQDRALTEHNMLTMYNPPEAQWQQKVLTQTREIFPKILARFYHLPSAKRGRVSH